MRIAIFDLSIERFLDYGSDLDKISVRELRDIFLYKNSQLFKIITNSIFLDMAALFAMQVIQEICEMTERQISKMKKNDLKRKIKFMIANDRTEIRRNQAQNSRSKSALV